MTGRRAGADRDLRRAPKRPRAWIWDRRQDGFHQGKPACVRIQKGKGVCGAAAARRSTVVVPDVSEFAGHIVCDPGSASEIAVSLEIAGRQLGVLDLDWPHRGRFDGRDQAELEALAGILLRATDWPEDIGATVS